MTKVLFPMSNQFNRTASGTDRAKCASSNESHSASNYGIEFGKKVIVDYLYLDLETCERCVGTDSVLDQVLATLTPTLSLAGFHVDYHKTEMKTAEIAAQHRFVSSPTIRVNGQDICPSVAENSCGCCSDISGTDVSCRVYEYHDETYEVPPAEMIAVAFLQAVFGQMKADSTDGEYELPKNLKEFFEGKKRKSGCSCGGSCS